jgi:hypothetical protein
MGVMRGFYLIPLAFIVASCGVQRPLIKPKDIPAFEEEQRKKREKIEQEMQEQQQELLQRQQAAPAESPQ